ncbi:craniofacial development 2-like protein [Labeo rohita]|uniref:Craniofacial development 2-like protein n=1 Tax=Labeo rohita TaxID=84645 RepID=A0A498LPB9_LABRO|nr:craniofacial development 2-like protein [Labeo rohita]RXN16378.1 craniofacial development 2-like protein [Labeo rohita]
MKTDQSAPRAKQPGQRLTPTKVSIKDASESQTEADTPTGGVLSAKVVTRIGYRNVRTLFQSSKLQQVIKEMEAYNINILGLSEVHWTGSSELSSRNKIALFSGRQDTIHRDGAALILDHQACKALEEWMPVNAMS